MFMGGLDQLKFIMGVFWRKLCIGCCSWVHAIFRAYSSAIFLLGTSILIFTSVAGYFVCQKNSRIRV